MENQPPSGSFVDYQSFFENAPDLYLILDPNFVIAGLSNAYARATKIEKEKVLGKSIFEVFPDNPDDPASEGVRNLKASLKRVLQTGHRDAMPVQKYDIRLPESEGGGFEARYWSPINTPILEAGGKVVHIIHKVDDVTEFVRLKQHGTDQDKLNEALRERAVRMESEVFSRTQEVADASAKLKSANQELETLYARSLELDRLKSQFFANISHELRTPLTLILSPLETRLRRMQEIGGLSEERKETEMMLRNARLLYRHISDLLDASKIEAGEMTMNWSRVDLSRAIGQTAHDFDSLAAERKIQYRIQLPPYLEGEIDPDKLQRILLNLLSNAFKFTPAGGGISVSAEQVGDAAILQVRDSGPGIPDEFKAAVFERFRQIDGSIQRCHEGTGLGLAIVKDFVALHLGTVTVQDAADGGCLFSVRIPLLAPHGTAITIASSPKDLLLQQTIEQLSLQQTRVGHASGDETAPLILVVEDNPDMNDYVAGLLGALYRVARAFDGREGLELARRLLPDLIVTDVMMPVMSGDELVKELRKLAATADISALMLTARYDDTFRLEMVRSGIQGYLNKPFTPEELLASVHNLLLQKRRVALRLRESDLRFEAAFEQTSVGIHQMTPDGKLIRVNRRLSQILGYTEEQFLQRTDFDITHPEDVPVTIAKIQSMTSGESDHYDYEKRYRHSCGRTVWGSVSASLVKKQDGAPDYIIAVVEDITERKATDELIWHQSNYDALTGLPNRHLLHDRLIQEMRKSSQNGHMLAVFSLGLDRFKEINDVYGRLAGDKLLCESAKRITSCVGGIGTVAHPGNDEFLIVLPDLDSAIDAERMAQKILSSVQKPVSFDTNEAFVTASIGISLYPTDAEQPDALLQNAEQAMCQVKNKGRNGYSYFVASMQGAALKRQRLIRDLRNALSASQMCLYYQPIVELATGRCFKAEALLRWFHPELGLVSPVEFIPLAEETGLIHEIGDWVFREAVREAARWQQLVGQPGEVQISINKSSRQITNGTTDKDWIEYLDKVGLDGRHIAIEITESLLLEGGRSVLDKLNRFLAKGIRFSLDDFGTGYSAMAYLKRFPIDFLKIDQSFVRDMTVAPSDQAIIEAIISMAHKLKIRVIAEGVETREQRQMLLDAGCDFAQGYLFAKPMPSSDFEQFVTNEL